MKMSSEAIKGKGRVRAERLHDKVRLALGWIDADVYDQMIILFWNGVS